MMHFWFETRKVAVDVKLLLSIQSLRNQNRYLFEQQEKSYFKGQFNEYWTLCQLGKHYNKQEKEVGQKKITTIMYAE